MSDSDDEHVFKPRGRVKKDDTWNPKGTYISVLLKKSGVLFTIAFVIFTEAKFSHKGYYV